MFITTAGDEALRKMERAGVLSASEIKSLTKIADGEDSTSHINIKKSTMTKLLRRILSEIGWVSTIGQMCQQLEQLEDSHNKRTKLLRTRVEKEQIQDATTLESTGCQADMPTPGIESVGYQATAEEGDKSKSKTCIFFRRGICRYGPSGTNSEGKCNFIHPLPCPAYDLFGYKTKYGCKRKKCSLMHRLTCRVFMKEGHCHGNCGHYHPKNLGKSSRFDGKHGVGSCQRRDGKHLVDKLIGQLVEALGGIGKSRGDKDNNFQPPSKVIERDKNVPGENSEK